MEDMSLVGSAAVVSEPLLVRVPEAARLLGLGRSTVYELIAAGDIEVVHVGRACRVPRSALDEFVERRRGDLGRLR
jgi:excisionase family DNA binding protein